jgi:hypothetical protein
MPPCVDDEGKRIKGETISFAYGTIKSVQEVKRTFVVNGKKTEGTLTLFDVKGDENAKKLFEFASNFSSSEHIEWSHAKVGAEGSNRNIVGTMHAVGASGVGSYLFNSKYTIRELNHSHPNGVGYTSGPDSQNADIYLKGNPKTILNIYIPAPNCPPDGLYIRYDGKGLIGAMPAIYMRPAEIQTDKK